MLNFQDLYESYAAEIYRFALRLSGNSHEAEDITSATFIRAWAHNNTIRTETLKAYLFTITRNVFLEQRRKRKHEVALEDVYTDPAPGPDKLVDAQFKLLRVQRVLQTLPEIDRTAFILRVENDLPYDEIARVLGLSLTATKVKVHRVRKKLIATCIDKEIL
ncbi:MAG TPA: RNA polymerase sigma factor [Bacteroidales bacterium]|nr:RNA polymerase sigma factor [Bacteroidales bacterium]